MAAGGAYTLNTIDRPAVVSFQERAGKPGGTKESSFSLNAPEHCLPSKAKESLTTGNPWDSQSERVYVGDGAWHSLNANESGGQSRDAVLAFTQNQREEVRNLGDVSGSLAAEPGIHQQTYVAAVDCRNFTESSDVNGTLQSKEQGYNVNGNNVVRVAVDIYNGKITGEVAPTVTTMTGGQTEPDRR